ncbi:MAG: DsrE/DsrF/TusD sulfur relay family protein [Bacteroidales bacterium]
MAQKILILINDAPYGTEKAYNALRVAMQLGKDHADTEVRVFLLADAANCALANQITPNGYYNIERMLKAVLAKGGKVKICGGCAESRGLKSTPLCMRENLKDDVREAFFFRSMETKSYSGVSR